MSGTRRAHVPVARRREQLVSAALRVMQRDGATNLTTRAVAEEADVSLGSVHYAFESKTDLVRAVLHTDRERATDSLSIALAGGGTALEVLVRAARGYAQGVIADPATETALQELAVLGAREPDLRDAARESVAEYRRDAATFLVRVAEAAGGQWDGDVRMLAESFNGSLFGLALNWLCERDDALFLQAVEDAAATLASRLSP